MAFGDTRHASSVGLRTTLSSGLRESQRSPPFGLRLTQPSTGERIRWTLFATLGCSRGPASSPLKATRFQGILKPGGIHSTSSMNGVRSCGSSSRGWPSTP